jgi:hypothetical protein
MTKASTSETSSQIQFQDPITKKWSLTRKVIGFSVSNHNYSLQEDHTAR